MIENKEDIVIKKKFKCKVCKQKFTVYVSMLGSYYHQDLLGGKQYCKGFVCPFCNQLFIKYPHDLFFRMSDYEYVVGDQVKKWG